MQLVQCYCKCSMSFKNYFLKIEQYIRRSRYHSFIHSLSLVCPFYVESMRYFQHSLPGAFPQIDKFPLAVRQLTDKNKKLKPDDGLLFFEVVSDRVAKVCTFKQGANYMHRGYTYRELISCKTFKEFPVWVFCERYDTDVDSSVFKKLCKYTISRVIRSSIIIKTLELEKFYRSYYKLPCDFN